MLRNVDSKLMMQRSSRKKSKKHRKKLHEGSRDMHSTSRENINKPTRKELATAFSKDIKSERVQLSPSFRYYNKESQVNKYFANINTAS